MAQEDGSFLYKIKLALDDSRGVENLSTSLEGVRRRLQGISAGAENMSSRLESAALRGENLNETFARAPGGMSSLRQQILQADDSLEDMARDAEVAFGKIQKGSLEASSAQHKVSRSLLRTKESQESLNKSLAAGSSRFNKTTQTSQNLLRIMQDSQFGMMGMANNFQALAESLGRASTRGRTAFEQLKAGLVSLMTGPMALPLVITAITLLAQNTDKLKSAATSAFEAMGLEINATNDDLQEFADQVEELEKTFGSFKFSDFTKGLQSFERGAEGAEKFMEKLELRFGTVRGELAPFNEALNDATTEFNSFSEGITLTNLATTSFQKTSTALVESLGLISGRMVEASNATGMTVEQIRDLRNSETTLEKALKASNATSSEQIRIRQKMQSLLGVERERAEELADEYIRLRDNIKTFSEITSEVISSQVEDNDRLTFDFRGSGPPEVKVKDPEVVGPGNVKFDEDLVKDHLEDQVDEEGDGISFRLRELRVEAMNDGLEQELTKIGLAVDKRREEIRQLDIKAEKQQKLLDLLDQIESQQRSAAFSEAQTRAEDQGGFSGLGFVRINGRFVEPSKFIERQRAEQQRVMNRLDRDREALGDERDQGITGGFSSGIGLVEQKLEQDILKQEEEIRKERLRQRRSFLQKQIELAEAQGDQEKAVRLQKTLDTMKTVADIEKKWQDKRKRQHQEYLQGIIDNYQSTPVGDAVMDMQNRVGAIIQTFQSDQLNWQKKTQREKAQIISQSASQVTGAAAGIAEGIFSTWREQRSRDLENQGKTAEERRKIMKKEGKRRFQVMKAVKIANAVTSGITATIASYEKGAEIGGPPLGAAFAATTAATMAMKINQLRKISIGDKFPGASGGGDSGGQFTQRAAASAATSAQRVGTDVSRAGTNNEDTINKTAERVGQEVANQMPDTVTMDRNTAEQSSDVAVSQKQKLNK